MVCTLLELKYTKKAKLRFLLLMKNSEPNRVIMDRDIYCLINLHNKDDSHYYPHFTNDKIELREVN